MTQRKPLGAMQQLFEIMLCLSYKEIRSCWSLTELYNQVYRLTELQDFTIGHIIKVPPI